MGRRINPKPVYPHEFSYSEADLWNNIYKERAEKQIQHTGGIKMKTTKLSPAEALKAEIMERYNLREDQIRLELSISTIDLDLGRQILSDFDRKEKYDRVEKETYLPEGNNCDYVYGKTINFVSVHTKDGFYGSYINEDGEDDE